MGHALNKILKDIINRYKVWFSTYFRYKLLPIFFDGFSSRLAWCLMDITELICPPDCILRTYWGKDIGNMSWMHVIIIVVAFCFIPMPFGLQGLGTPGILVWYSGMLLLMWFTWWRLERVVIWISERRKSQTAAGLLLRPNITKSNEFCGSLDILENDNIGKTLFFIGINRFSEAWSVCFHS